MTTIRYIVNDVAASLAFYTKHLGFEELENFGIPFASVKRGDTILWLALAPRVLRPGRCRMESSRSPAAGIGARVPLGAE